MGEEVIGDGNGSGYEQRLVSWWHLGWEGGDRLHYYVHRAFSPWNEEAINMVAWQ